MDSPPFVLSGSNRVIATFHADGTVWINPDLKVDDAAKAVIEALQPQLQKLNPQFKPLVRP